MPDRERSTGFNFIEELKKPANLAAAIFFAGNIARNGGGKDGVLDAGARAFAFRGGIEQNLQGRRDSERDFNREEAVRLREERMQQQQIDDERANNEAQLAVSRQNAESVAEQARANSTQAQASMQNAQSLEAQRIFEQEWQQNPMRLMQEHFAQVLPGLQDSILQQLQYDETMTEAEKIAFAGENALRQAMASFQMTQLMSQFPANPDGTWSVPDEMWNQVMGGQGGAPGAPAPAAATPGGPPPETFPLPTGQLPPQGMLPPTQLMFQQGQFRQGVVNNPAQQRQINRSLEMGELTMAASELKNKMAGGADPSLWANDTMQFANLTLRQLNDIGFSADEIAQLRLLWRQQAMAPQPQAIGTMY